MQRKPQLWQFASHARVKEEIIVGADRRNGTLTPRVQHKHPTQQNSAVDRKNYQNLTSFTHTVTSPGTLAAQLDPRCLDTCSRKVCAPCVHSYLPMCSKNIELLFSQKKLCHHKNPEKLSTVLWLLLDTLPGWRRKKYFQLHSSIKNIFLKEFCSLFQEPW